MLERDVRPQQRHLRLKVSAAHVLVPISQGTVGGPIAYEVIVHWLNGVYLICFLFVSQFLTLRLRSCWSRASCCKLLCPSCNNSTKACSAAFPRLTNPSRAASMTISTTSLKIGAHLTEARRTRVRRTEARRTRVQCTKAHLTTKDRL